MSPQPSDPQKGKPADQEQAANESTEAAQASGQEAAAEQAEAPKPKRRRAARKKPKQAEGAAAQTTGVDKEVAEAGEGTETDEPAVEAQPEETVVEGAEAPEGEPEQAPTAQTPDEEPAQASAGEAAAERSPRAARRRRDRRPSPAASDGDGAQAAVMVRAHARFVRSSARKARLVSDHIRGKSVEDARAILALAQRDVARDWAKLLESAVANAEHNHELVEDDLRIYNAFADEGPTLKRFQPRAQGRATRIRKRTSHLTITLTPGGGRNR